MKNKWYTPTAKTSKDNVIVIGVDLAKLPSQTHKWGAIKNKAQVFEDRRFKRPKHKLKYMED